VTARDFCFWLQGKFELDGDDITSKGLTPQQTEMIRRHLSLVFIHDIDPKAGNAEEQKKLNEAHTGKSPWTPAPRPPLARC